MVRRRALLRSMAGAAVSPIAAGCLQQGGDGSAGADGSETTMHDDFTFTTSAFDDGAPIPAKYTADGQSVSPPLSIDGVPDDAAALAVVVDDPDAPGGVFTHWLLWNVPADAASVPEGVPHGKTVDELDGAKQGTNDFGNVGYDGPKPPKGHGAHTYRFKCYALSETLDVSAGAKAKAVNDAVESSTLASAGFTGEYER